MRRHNSWDRWSSKLRIAASGRGKRGGARVVYLYGGVDVPVFLLAIFAKNEESNLS